MSKKTRILISCILVVFAFCAGIVTYLHSYGNRTEIANAEGTTDFFVDAAGKIKVPVEPKAGETITAEEKEANRLTRGTEGNPFFILEITPYEGFAQFGYHIAGCEPVDIDRMLWDGKSASDIYGASTLYEVVSYNASRYYWEKDFPAGYSGGTEATVNQYGTMTLVTDNSGNYKRVEGEDSEIYETAPDDYEGVKYIHDEATDTYTEDENGTFLRRIVGKYEPATDGDYKWVPLSVEENLEAVKDDALVEEYEKSSHEGNEFKAYFPDVKYIYKNNLNEIVHRNTFLRESVGLAYEMKDGKRVAITDEEEIQKKIDAFKVVVYTVTPEDLNMNLELIDRADMISFALKDSTSAALNAYKAGYGKPELFAHDESTDLGKRVKNVESATFATNVLDWSTTVAIYERVNNTTKACPVLFNTHIISDIAEDNKKEVEIKAKLATGKEIKKKVQSTQNNLYKLFLMLYQMPTSTFESLYKHPNTFDSENIKTELKNKDGSVIQTGKISIYSSDVATYWSEFTLIPWGILTSDNSDVYTKTLDSLEILSNAGAVYHFAAGGAQNYLMHNFLLCDGGTQFSTGFTSDSGLKDNVYGHEVFKFFENIGVDKDSYTTAECLYYLLHGLTADRARNSAKYKVLELQPSNSMLSKSYWQVFVSTYAKTNVVPDVDQMTTAEFIGKNVDVLAEYDLVYIGMNKRDKDPTLHTNFTYAHTGPQQKIDKKYTVLQDWLDKSAKEEAHLTLLYSGNDLTLLKKTQLKDYANSGAALLFGTDFFTSAKAEKASEKIDVNSYIYQLQNEVTNHLYEGALSDAAYHLTAKAALQTALAKGRRVEMVMHSSPIIYIYEDGKPPEKMYINGANNDNRTLKFKFTLNAPVGNKYKAVLYTDINGDGKFTSDENIGVTVKESGGGGVYELVGGKTYEVSRVVRDRIGSLSWKLDIVKDGVVYDSLSGVSAIKAKDDGSEDITIKVLQIVQEPDQKVSPNSDVLCTVYLPETDAFGNMKALPSEATKEMKEVTQTFYDLTRNINGMDILFERMTQTEIEEKLELDGEGNPKKPNYLKESFDMIIIGFADVYQGITLLPVRDAITRFIDSGRAVLFTHDTASLSGKTGEGGINDGNLGWGSTYTHAYRDIFAMDRYDVVAQGSSTGKTRGDYPYVVSSDTKDIGNVMTVDGHVLVQGFANGIIQRYGVLFDNLNAKEVTQVNRGAITEYPFTIDERIEVAQTHSQYYQLDMEQDNIVVWYCLDGSNYKNDDKKDKYTISDDAIKKLKTYYQETPNDVRNNYYIYNAGNITYSGVGHHGLLSDAEIKLFINTFVAAYRAAARPAQVIIENDDATKLAGDEKYYLCVDVSNSDATKVLKTGDIVDSYRLQSGNNESGYTLDAEITQQSKRVYFKIVNNSAYGNVEFDLKFYLNESVTSTPDPDASLETPLAVFRSSDNKFMDGKSDSTKIEPSVEYYVDVPIRMEEKKVETETTYAIGTTELDIRVVMTYGAEQLKTDPLYTEADILPRGMFDLD